MTRKGFIFTTDAMLSLLALFVVLGMFATINDSRTIEMNQNLHQKTIDAAIVSTYMGETPASWPDSVAISDSFDSTAYMSACSHFLEYNEAEDTVKTEQWFCYSLGVAP